MDEATIGHADLLRSWLLSDPLIFTRYFFKDRFNKRFVVGAHHVKIAEALHRVLMGQTKRLIINIAPRYGKTELAVKNFIAMGLAFNPRAKFIHLSYSENLALDNSEAVKDIVTSEAFRHIFRTRLRKGHTSKSEWDTLQGGGLYATSTLGQITGFGAGLVETEEEEQREGVHEFGGAIVIDDPIKPEDALSDQVRETVNRRFETTIRNRVNSRHTPIIIIMQRLHEHDLCGYLNELEPDDWEILSIPCLTEEGEPLWPFKHSKEELEKIQQANSFVFDTQYMQNPTPIEGLMYHAFKIYEKIPIAKWVRKMNYTDSADTGADFLCSICYDALPDANYVTDVLFTKKPMEFTEPALAEMLTKNKTEDAWIESNNGGRGFRRNVESQTRLLGNTRTTFHDFTQRVNKNVRIFTKSADVNNITIFPSDWERRWPEFAKQIKSYRKEGGNAHDDAPDALTGTFEKRPTLGKPINLHGFLGHG